MGACAPVRIASITRQKFLAIRARINAQATKITIDGDTGTATGSAMGGTFSVTWSYDEPSQGLTVQCTEKPFWMREAWVNDKIQSLAESVSL